MPTASAGRRQVCQQVWTGVIGPVCEATKTGMLSGMATADVDALTVGAGFPAVVGLGGNTVP